MSVNSQLFKFIARCSLNNSLIENPEKKGTFLCQVLDNKGIVRYIYLAEKYIVLLENKTASINKENNNNNNNSTSTKSFSSDTTKPSSSASAKSSCSISAKPSSSSSTSAKLNNKDDDVQWSKEMAQILVNCYRELTNDDQKKDVFKKNVFKEAAKRINKSGKFPTVNFEKCSSKYSGLMQTYKKHVDLQNQSGADRSHWEYFDMIHEYMHKKPEIKPLSTASSLNGFKLKRKNKVDDEEEEEEEEKKPKKKPKKKETKRDSELREVYDAMRERTRAHQRIASCLERYLNILEKDKIEE